MRNFAKWLLKSLAIGAVWVFLLSVPFRGQMLFDHAHELLIQNSLMKFVDDRLNSAIEDLKVLALSALTDKQVEKSVESF